MFSLVPMLLSAIQGMVVDKAQSLATEHVEQAIKDHLPEEAQELLNKAIEEDPSHSAKNLQDFLKL
jgi:demethoxyubiquinone hydroxylase (CLK1/Coq7/Cat5 family)